MATSRFVLLGDSIAYVLTSDECIYTDTCANGPISGWYAHGRMSLCIANAVCLAATGQMMCARGWVVETWAAIVFRCYRNSPGEQGGTVTWSVGVCRDEARRQKQYIARG